MKKLLMLFLSSLVFLGTAGMHTVSAADFRTGEEVIISEGTNDLKDVYLFGGNIRVNAPVTNDAIVAGGDVSINQDVTGSVMAAGGNINLGGTIGNTVRAAGGNIRVDGPITRDFVVTGGSITVTKNASIGQDLIFTGGNLVLEGPVKGKVIIHGGNVTINSTVGGNVEGEIEKLALGPSARINGDLTYKSTNKAQMASGAVVQGKTNYTPIERTERQRDAARELITAGAIYKLITDILISVLLIYFFGQAIMRVIRRIAEKPAESGAIGFTFIFFFPIAAFIALILFLLGIAGFITYGLVLLISLYLAKIFAGWWLLHWWEGRNKRQYQLDWKAGIFGPVVLFLLGLIPFIGWIPAALLFFVTTGAFIMEIIGLMRGQKALAPLKTAPKKK